VKTRRQEKILEIIAQRDIETQQMLADALREAGFSSTQATISRDIRDLSLVKEMSEDGVYRYVVAVREGAYGAKLRTIFRESVDVVACAQNLVVLKTLPGLASAACSALDSMGIPGLVGSIAGDDTAFLAMRDSASAERLRVDISDMLK